MSAKTILRNSIARILFQMKLTSPDRCGYGRLSIATFHRVLPEASRQAYPYPGLVVTPEELDELLTYFTQHFDCGTLASQHEHFMSGKATARPLLAITFDDAQHDNFMHARPVLDRHHLKASFFVPVIAVEKQELLWHDRLGFAALALLNSDRTGNEQLVRIMATAGLPKCGPRILVSEIAEASKTLIPDARLRFVESLEAAAGHPCPPEFARLMTLEEITELASDGHEIGSHSMTHCMMPECDDRGLIYEVAESRRQLQAFIGHPIETFCYPNGNADTRTAQAVSQSGYRRAVTTTWGSNAADSDRYLLRRFDMDASRVQDANGKILPSLLAFRMSGLYPGHV